jgi:hypothetical protein
MAYQLNGLFTRDGILFSYEIIVEQPAPKLVRLDGIVRQVARLDESGMPSAAHGKALMMVGTALHDLHQQRTHVTYGGQLDGFTCSLSALKVLTPEYVHELHAGLRQHLREEPLEHYIQTHIN